jgi:hypothetical protein
MENYHKYDIGEEVYFIRNNKLAKGNIRQVNITLTKNRIGIKVITTNYYVNVKSYGNMLFKENDIHKTPESLIQKMKKNLKK